MAQDRRRRLGAPGGLGRLEVFDFAFGGQHDCAPVVGNTVRVGNIDLTIEAIFKKKITRVRMQVSAVTEITIG